MDIKKYPAFYATVCIFGSICAAGVVWLAYLGLFDYPNKKSALEKDDQALGRMIKAPVAPTDANVAKAKKNLDMMGESEASLLETLKGKPPRFNPTDIEAEPQELKTLVEDVSKKFPQYLQYSGSASDLSGDFRESAGKLDKAIAAKKVKIYKKAEFGYGFKRYINTGTFPTGNLQELAIQNGSVCYLVSVLLSAKGPKDELILQEVKREPVEIQSQSGARLKLEVDEYKPAPNETIRRDGIAKTLYFRMKFTTRSVVLRRFINRIRASEMPLFVRGVQVAVANENVLQTPDPFQASDSSFPQAPASTTQSTADQGTFPLPDAQTEQFPGFPAATGTGNAVIVKDAPSEFTVSFEYILPDIPSADADVKPANN